MQERLSMRKVKDVLRLKYDGRFSNRQIAQSLHISRSAVAEYLARAAAANFTWPLPVNLTEEELEAQLFKRPTIFSEAPAVRALPDFAHVHDELRTHQKVNLTLSQLWIEYKDEHPDGYQYTQYCEHYRRWRRRTLDPVMRQTHKPGERLFVDYGDGLSIVDSSTGKKISTQLWVGAWGASSFTFAEATLSQALPAWTMSHVHAMDYFGCCPHVVVPDNLKAGVSKVCFYEPDINPTYADLANHYGFAVLPTRRAKPRDKAIVENGVLVSKRWILAVLRHRTFYSLEELNKAIRELLEKLNNRPMRKLKKSRRELFEELDRPNARPLPAAPYAYAEWKKARLNIDYHCEIDKHYYSAPFRLIHEALDIRLTPTTVEAFHKGERVAAHARSYVPYKYTTCPEHMPPSHQKHLEWSPSRLLSWAGTIGPCTSLLLKKILEGRAHPEQGYRACLGVMRLAGHYSQERVEAAALRAIQFDSCSFKSFKNILFRGLDRLTPGTGNDSSRVSSTHGNIRGPKYYH